jgi:hypothetical protein
MSHHLTAMLNTCYSLLQWNLASLFERDLSGPEPLLFGSGSTAFSPTSNYSLAKGNVFTCTVNQQTAPSPLVWWSDPNEKSKGVPLRPGAQTRGRRKQELSPEASLMRRSNPSAPIDDEKRPKAVSARVAEKHQATSPLPRIIDNVMKSALTTSPTTRNARPTTTLLLQYLA